MQLLTYSLFQVKFNKKKKSQKVQSQVHNFPNLILGGFYKDIQTEDNPQVIIMIRIDGHWIR